jgi:hypothetical protein
MLRADGDPRGSLRERTKLLYIAHVEELLVLPFSAASACSA